MFPTKANLKKVRAKLEKAEGTLLLSPEATPMEKLRWELCQKFIQYKNEHELTQEQLAEELGVDKAKISKILHHRIDEFSTDRLNTLYQQINPGIKIRVG